MLSLWKINFAGEYKNGERNGKGIEYSINEEILFEGEYLNNKRWNGKGKEFGNFEQLKFEGEYKEGNKIGKEYYDDMYEIEGEKHEYGENILIYEGEFINGKRWNGIGKEYKKGKLIFVGEYLNGKKINKDDKKDKKLKAKK